MRAITVLLLLAIALPAGATLQIFATVPEWAALAREIGGDRAHVHAATHGLQDPHHIDAKPSLIARARQADLVIATGAELESGWLPVVLRESGNARVQPGRPGYFEAAAFVRMLEVPARLDRADGDVHGAGNPHIQTDPRSFLKVGEALAVRLAELDAAHANAYAERYAAFAKRFRQDIARWERQAAPLRGLAVISQHKGWAYLYDWLGIKEVGVLEPVPGMEPSPGHLATLRAQTAISRPRLVIRAAYQGGRPAEWFSAQARIPVAVLPFTVGGSERAQDLTSLFDDTVDRLLRSLT
jgi:zinc/manganese transport system substrate-binding protein